MAALAAIEPILFYDEIVLYEDELADNGGFTLNSQSGNKNSFLLFKGM